MSVAPVDTGPISYITWADEEKIKKKPWSPHKLSWTETPYLFLFAKVLPRWIKVRNAVVRNRVFEWRVPFSLCPRLHRAFTLSECLVFLFFLAATVGFTVAWFVFKITVHDSGYVACVPFVLSFMLASHNSIFTFFLGIPFERAIFWHKLLALITIFISFVHGWRPIVHLVFPSTNNGTLDEAHILRPMTTRPDCSTGIALTVILILFIVFSLNPVRRRFWNLFYLGHIVLIIILIPYSILHGAGIATYIAVGVWLFDVAFRYVYLVIFKNPHKATAVRLPSNVIRLSISKPDKFVYSPGQYAFLMIPKVSIWEWHPFSISSSPHHDMLTFHIRVLGNWTETLYDKIKVEKEIYVQIEGPYGCPEIDLEHKSHKMFLFISGGIGITPLQSMCNHLLQQSKNGRPIKKIWFVWSCSDKYMVSTVFEHDRQWDGISNKNTKRLPYSFQPDELEHINTSSELSSHHPSNVKYSQDVLHTEFYLTRVRSADEGFAEANIRPELQPYVRFGRPKLPEIFETMSSCAKIQKEDNVATFVCGPENLVNDVRKMCSKFSKDGLRFEFHSESFEF